MKKKIGSLILANLIKLLYESRDLLNGGFCLVIYRNLLNFIRERERERERERVKNDIINSN